MAIAGLSPAGVADANCVYINGAPIGTGCPNTSGGPRQQLAGVGVGPRPSSTSTTAIRPTSTPTSGALPGFVPGNIDTARGVGNPVVVAESMVGSDAFGPYGCEDFVDAVYGRTTATGIGHDGALAFYQSLADRGLAHHDMPVPRGALAFSTGADGGHVDISRGDNTYVSGGVQGLWPGYGDGHNVQILPAPNLGSWTLYGWVYPPW
jgi:hypothetical protein